MSWKKWTVLVVGVALVLIGCEVRLPTPAELRAGQAAGGHGGDNPALSVRAEPEAPLEAVTTVLRIHIEAGSALDPAKIALVRGAVGPNQLRDIGRGQPSKALSERFVPVVAWAEGAGVVVSPSALLEIGEVYTLALGEIEQTRELRAAAGPPLLTRRWPPPGASAQRAFTVWCNEATTPPLAVPTRLEPGGPRGWFRRGVIEGGRGERCLRFEADGDGAAGAWIPPPSVASPDGETLLIEPLSLSFGGDSGPGEVVALSCAADEIVFGPGCARVLDDRLLGRAPAAPLLWAVSGASIDAVIAVGAGDPFVITGISPATDVILDVATIDARGTPARMLVATVTAAPMPHPILNEVLANPLGPEPAAEWVEIVNDGQAPVDLGGYALSDGGGDTVLPSFTLAPGAFALIVNEAYDPEGGADAAPAPEALLVRVPHLGKNGLSNSGEPLTLRDPEGAVISRFPAVPKPKAGESVARRAPSSPDALAASFAVATPSPGKHNVW